MSKKKEGLWTLLNLDVGSLTVAAFLTKESSSEEEEEEEEGGGGEWIWLVEIEIEIEVEMDSINAFNCPMLLIVTSPNDFLKYFDDSMETGISFSFFEDHTFQK